MAWLALVRAFRDGGARGRFGIFRVACMTRITVVGRVGGGVRTAMGGTGFPEMRRGCCEWSVSSSSLAISILLFTPFFTRRAANPQRCFVRLHATQAPPPKSFSQMRRRYSQRGQGGSWSSPDGRRATLFERGVGRITCLDLETTLFPESSDSSVSGARARCLPFFCCLPFFSTGGGLSSSSSVSIPSISFSTALSIPCITSGSSSPSASRSPRRMLFVATDAATAA